MDPGATSLAPPCSNLGTFVSKCTVLKKVLVTVGTFRRPVNCYPSRYAPASGYFISPPLSNLCLRRLV